MRNSNFVGELPPDVWLVAPRTISEVFTILFAYSTAIRDRYLVELGENEDIRCSRCKIVIWSCKDVPFGKYWSRHRKFQMVLHFLSEARRRDSHLKNPQTGSACLWEVGVRNPPYYDLCTVLANSACPPEMIQMWWEASGSMSNQVSKEIRKSIFSNPVLDLLGLETQWALDIIAAKLSSTGAQEPASLTIAEGAT